MQRLGLCRHRGGGAAGRANALFTCPSRGPTRPTPGEGPVQAGAPPQPTRPQSFAGKVLCLCCRGASREQRERRAGEGQPRGPSPGAGGCVSCGVSSAAPQAAAPPAAPPSPGAPPVRPAGAAAGGAAAPATFIADRPWGTGWLRVAPSRGRLGEGDCGSSRARRAPERPPKLSPPLRHRARQRSADRPTFLLTPHPTHPPHAASGTHRESGTLGTSPKQKTG